ncbi:MAG: hypothetical protein PHW18_08335 [Sulfuricurvum sp.]|uniref:COG3014 family protein n=1 Tax=Sulfuricurvum sp. TaxID=2025608 RepID=UPI00261FC068|nr:hypothetical protein [Sulfuricurvum sp.]MDD2829563.1 hypothetical protein [Sulfuricurvum sp.]MDD4950390.1 hypothetical protein [Sulfuricurvum sp.]
MNHFLFKTLLSFALLHPFMVEATSLKPAELRLGLTNEAFNSTLSALSSDTSDTTQLWYWLDLARLQQANGDYKGSIKSFENGFAILDEYENRAKASIRNIGSFLGSTLFSKGAESYYGKGYERTLMHTINALNYTMLGDFEGAAVEMRRMDQRQEFWLQENSERLKEATKDIQKAQQQGNNTTAIPNGYSMGTLLENPEVRSLANSYQDPFSYTLSKIIFDLSSQSETGEISLKRALALNPDVAKVFVTPTISHNNKNLKKEPLSSKKIEVTLIVLSGLAPSLTLEKIHFPLFNGANYSSIDLSSYTPPLNDISFLTISTPTLRIQPPRLLKADIMAYKTLKDELPGELSKAVVRATSKAIAAQQASNQFGPLGGFVASLAMDIGSSVSDTKFRNWNTLPNSGYLSKFTANSEDIINITLNQAQESLMLPSDKIGIIILVSYLAPNNIRISHVDY